MDDWKNLPWIKDFADFFKISAEDVKLVYEVFIGDRVNSWPHPFGEIAEWVYDWNSERTQTIRHKIKEEKRWNWDNVGAKILQNEIYRRVPTVLNEYNQFKKVISDYQQQKNKDILILDYGCGTSNVVEHVVDIPNTYYDLKDTDPVVVEYCRHKFRNNSTVLSCELIPSLNKYTGDACRVPTLPVIYNRFYDIIYTMDVLEHTLDPLTILVGMVNHLKEGGLLLFNYPDNIEGDWHTPEANYLRPFCLFYINLLLTQEGVVVFRKTCSKQVEKKVNILAKLFSVVSKPFIKKYAIEYLRNTPYAEKYNLKGRGFFTGFKNEDFQKKN
jgi:SAM-dependent methyltransferase